METFEIDAVVNEDGTVVVKMPNGHWTAGRKVKITVDLEANGEAESWPEFVRRTYGSLPDFPDVRLNDLPDDVREPLE